MIILREELYDMVVYNITLISCVLRRRGDKSSENIFSAVMSDNAKFARNEGKEVET